MNRPSVVTLPHVAYMAERAHVPPVCAAVGGLYCVGDSTFPGQGVNAVVFSGFGCAHRALCDLGLAPTLPVIDGAYNALLSAARDAV